MYSLFTYAGNKSKFQNIIQKYLIDTYSYNNIDICIDLFAGTSGFFNVVQDKKQFKHTILNDLNTSITTLLSTIKDKKEILILEVEKELNYIKNKYSVIDTQEKSQDWFFNRLEKLNFLEDKKDYDNTLLSTYFLLLNSVSFGGNYETNNGISNIPRSTDLKKYKTMNSLIIKKVEYYNNIYQKNNAVICNEDYKTIIRNYGYEDILYLIDPPYISSNSNDIKGCVSNYKNGDNFNHLELLEELDMFQSFIYFNNKHIVIDDIISAYDIKYKEIERKTTSSNQNYLKLSDFEYMLYR